MSLEYVAAYYSYLDFMAELSDAECGRLFKACLTYGKTGAVPELRGNERFVWPGIKSQIDRGREKQKSRSGENHWNWKGGITPKNQMGRNSLAYKKWRTDVFRRDNYTCQMCGARGGNLNAHHKKPWAKFPEFRFSLENGITLCHNCHKTVHGRKRK